MSEDNDKALRLEAAKLLAAVRANPVAARALRDTIFDLLQAAKEASLEAVDMAVTDQDRKTHPSTKEMITKVIDTYIYTVKGVMGELPDRRPSEPLN